ncbi:MAG TPA: M28 family peptidase [Longimicrobiales bacterium]|nr:M28 family peptidase [Longimicrobiales bacterium]
MTWRARTQRCSCAAAAAAVLLGASCGGRAEQIGPTPGRPAFDGEAALELVRTQVAFGPRVPGTDAHRAQLAWMVARLDSLAPEVAVDTFTHTTTAGEELTLYNVSARFRPDVSRRILLLAHWDTRPRSDQAADPEDRDVPVPGANDGASGTAVLLELARLFADVPPPMGVDLLLVDGEDWGPGAEDMFLGARRYASRLPEEGRPIYGLLLDMVGDTDPSFPPEELSAQHASIVVRKVRAAAERLGYDAYFPSRVIAQVYDDHVALIEAGLPTANLVDFEYGPSNRYWHTPQDDLEHVSAATLGMIGEVVAELIYSGG